MWTAVTTPSSPGWNAEVEGSLQVPGKLRLQIRPCLKRPQNKMHLVANTCRICIRHWLWPPVPKSKQNWNTDLAWLPWGIKTARRNVATTMRSRMPHILGLAKLSPLPTHWPLAENQPLSTVLVYIISVSSLSSIRRRNRTATLMEKA